MGGITGSGGDDRQWNLPTDPSESQKNDNKKPTQKSSSSEKAKNIFESQSTSANPTSISDIKDKHSITQLPSKNTLLNDAFGELLNDPEIKELKKDLDKNVAASDMLRDILLPKVLTELQGIPPSKEKFILLCKICQGPTEASPITVLPFLDKNPDIEQVRTIVNDVALLNKTLSRSYGEDKELILETLQKVTNTSDKFLQQVTLKVLSTSVDSGNLGMLGNSRTLKSDCLTIENFVKVCKPLPQIPKDVLGVFYDRIIEHLNEWGTISEDELKERVETLEWLVPILEVDTEGNIIEMLKGSDKKQFFGILEEVSKLLDNKDLRISTESQKNLVQLLCTSDSEIRDLTLSVYKKIRNEWNDLPIQSQRDLFGKLADGKDTFQLMLKQYEEAAPRDYLTGYLSLSPGTIVEFLENFPLDNKFIHPFIEVNRQYENLSDSIQIELTELIANTIPADKINDVFSQHKNLLNTLRFITPSNSPDNIHVELLMLHERYGQIAELTDGFDNEETAIFLTFLLTIRDEERNDILDLLQSQTQSITNSGVKANRIFKLLKQNSSVSEKYGRNYEAPDIVVNGTYVTNQIESMPEEDRVHLTPQINRLLNYTIFVGGSPESNLNFINNRHIVEIAQLTKSYNSTQLIRFLKMLSLPRQIEDRLLENGVDILNRHAIQNHLTAIYPHFLQLSQIISPWDSTLSDYEFEDLQRLLIYLRYIPTTEISEFLNTIQRQTEHISLHSERFRRVTELFEQHRMLDYIFYTPPNIRMLSRINLTLLPLVADTAPPPREATENQTFNIAREDLTNHPLEVLHNLETSNSFDPEKLRIEFIGEAGIDASGLKREFIGELSAGIKNKLNFKTLDNGLALPFTSTLTEIEKQAYREFGKLLMFVLNTEENYPTGMLFDQGLFTALAHMPEVLLDKTIEQFLDDEKGFDTLVELYADMNSVNEKEIKNMDKLRQYSAPFTPQTNEKTLKDAFSFAALDFDSDPDLDALGITIDTIKSNLSAVQKAVQKRIVSDRISPTLVPIVEIAKGMSTAGFEDISWDTVQHMRPSELSEKIQGQLSADIVLKRLTFNEGIPVQKQEWIQNWVRDADIDTLKRFVFAITGARAVGSLPLKISPSINQLYFHTCFNLVDLPLAHISSQNELNELMINALAGVENDKYNRS